MSVAFALAAFSRPCDAAYSKTSQEQYCFKTTCSPTDLGCCGGQSTYRSAIQFNPTDCGTGTEQRTMRGSNFQNGTTIAANTIYMICPSGAGPVTVHGTHSQSVTVADGTGSETSHASNTLVTWNPLEIAAITPNINAQAVWCDVKIPVTANGNSYTWTYLSGFRLDAVPPDATTAGHFFINSIVPLPGGGSRINFSFMDPVTPADEDGECDTGTCNKTDTRFQYQWFRTQQGSSYNSSPSFTTSPPATTLDDNTNLANQDRYQPTPATKAFCYKVKVRDSCGNNSQLSTVEQCFTPDSRAPFSYDANITSYKDPLVVPYRDAGFSQPLGQDSATSTLYNVTSDPCFFDPATCRVDASRTVYLKVIVNEPLFDENDKMGYTMPIPACSPPPPGAADDGLDNDCNGYIDEWPNNKANSDATAAYCQPKMLWNYSQGVCVKYPVISIVGPDNRGMVPSIYNVSDRLQFICSRMVNAPDPFGLASSLCAADVATGTTIYRFPWDLSGNTIGLTGGVDEGDYEVRVTGADSVGNLSDSVYPKYGKYMRVDNTGPAADVGLFANSAFTQNFRTADHDNDSSSPNMPLVGSGTVYVRLTLSEPPGSTPTVTVYTPPTYATPAYAGAPSATHTFAVQMYQSCLQSPGCDLCNGGSHCSGFSSTDVSDQVRKCKVFYGCFQVVPGVTGFDGYSAISVDTTDRYGNDNWNVDNAHAQVDANDTDGLSDDIIPPADAHPTCLRTWGCTNYLTQPSCTNDTNKCRWDAVTSKCKPACEPDAQITSGQYFAVDTLPPATPVISFPVTPCNGSMARTSVAEGDCDLPTEQSPYPTTNQVLFSWTRLPNDTSTGTAGWEVAYWHLQVASDTTFSTSSIVVDQALVVGNSYTSYALPQRPLTNPYYWRISAIDWANNQGGTTPPMGTGPAYIPYFTFGIDTQPPVLTVRYYFDSARTREVIKNSQNVPVVGDTYNKIGEEHYIYVKLTSDEPLGATPTFRLRQNGAWVPVPDTVTSMDLGNASHTVYTSRFVVAAKGADAEFVDGTADFVVTTKDRYGNSIINAAPATGSVLFIDAQSPVIAPQDITIRPDPASLDTNHNSIPNEASDVVTIRINVSEFLKEPFRIRVLQPGIDPASASTVVPMTLDGSGLPTYYGYYHVLPGLDNASLNNTTVRIGDTDSSSLTYVTDFAYNTVVATATFTVDTTAPSAPTPSGPPNAMRIKDSKPTFAWGIASRGIDLSQYWVYIATNSAFINYATASVSDDGSSTAFYYRPSAPMPDGTYYWTVKAIDDAFNMSASGTAPSGNPPFFYIDNVPPDPPLFDAVTSPTVNCTTPITGTTSKPNCRISIYANDVLLGSAQSDDTGKFDVRIDSDSDGNLDPYEEPCGTVTQVDSDFDGKTNEDPPGIYLQEGTNVLKGIVVDQAGNSSADRCGIYNLCSAHSSQPTCDDDAFCAWDAAHNKCTGQAGCQASSSVCNWDAARNICLDISSGCSKDTPFYNGTTKKCEIVRDSGPPMFHILYYSSPTFSDASLLPIHPTSGKPVAKAGAVYMRILPTKALLSAGVPNPPKFSITQQGSTTVSNVLTNPVNSLGTEFAATYTVRVANGSGYIDGDAKVIVIGKDSNTNETPAGTLPLTGPYFTIDTASPTFDVSFYKDSDLNARLPRDASLTTVAKAGQVYLRIMANEVLGVAPKATVMQGGATLADHVSATSVNITGVASGTIFSVPVTVFPHDATYIDGTATVKIAGADVGGNVSTDIDPSIGSHFTIDTTPPAAPSLLLPSETVFTQVDGSGTSPEPYITIQAFGWSINDLGGSADMSLLGNAIAGGPPSNHYSITVAGLSAGKNYITVRGIDLAENVGDFATPPVMINNSAPVEIELSHTFGSGWSLIGFPLQPTLSSPDAAIAATSTATFCRYSTGGMKCKWYTESIAPGRGYWAWIPATTTANIHGISSNTSRVVLKAGWNMVSVPYNLGVAWAGTTISVTDGTNTYRLDEAGASTLLDTNIYLYNGAAYQKKAPGATVLEPWVGFLLKAKQNCTLIFPTP